MLSVRTQLFTVLFLHKTIVMTTRHWNLMQMLTVLSLYILSSSTTTTTLAKMYNVLEKNKKQPASCKNGCAKWSEKDANLWVDAKIPEDAGSSCAQPGAAVNDYIYGSWCFCAEAPSPSPPSPSPGPPSDHPLNGSTYLLYNTYAGEANDKYVSFAFSDAPSGEPAGTTGCNWLRVTYTDQNDAMPILFVGVEGKKDVYVLFNDWGDSDYQRYLKADSTKGFISSCAPDLADAVEIKVVPTSEVSPTIGDDDGNDNDTSSTTYVFIDAKSGKYVSYRNDGFWIANDYSDKSDAMTFELVPKGVQPGNAWNYCTSYEHVPEQVNVQIASADSVVISFVTFPTNTSLELATSSSIPIVKVGTDPKHLNQTVQGATHLHTTAAGDRTYLMHFVRLSNLHPKTRYYYAVQDGVTSDSTWSETYNFRSMPAIGDKVVIDIFGDMGVYVFLCRSLSVFCR